MVKECKRMEQIKKKIEEVVQKIKNDKNFAAKFQEDPVKALEGVLGVDLPEDQINAVISGVKAKINLDTVSDLLDSDGDGKPDLGALSKLGGILGKK